MYVKRPRPTYTIAPTLCTGNGPGLHTQLPIIYVRETLSASALDLLKVDPQQLTAGGANAPARFGPPPPTASKAAPSTLPHGTQHPPPPRPAPPPQPPAPPPLRHPTPPRPAPPPQPPAPAPTAPHTTPSTAPSAAPKASFKIPAQKKFRGADNKNGTRVQWLRSPWEDGPPPRRPRGSYPNQNGPQQKIAKLQCVTLTPWAAGEPHWGFSFIPWFFLPRGFTVHIHQHCSFSHLWASHAGEGHFAGLHNDIQAGQPHETRNSVLRSTQR